MRFSTISLFFLGLASIAFAAPRPMESNSEGVTPSSSETISQICGGTCTAKVVIGVGSGGALKVQGRIYNSAKKLIFPVTLEKEASERSRKNLVRRGVSSAGFEACRLDLIERRAGLAVLH
ncbi:hypothetical protein C8J55DRAFT_241726 [Lentinula edodes]|uniref:Uncharacterized protein n=1 Tax=Lentinula lateritia TaxID=40482 RepID=A0A9W9DF41_9AGAR|nr:hypothetical protein C8J55DRAFT_241726 [Lentinula edodes]